jgi:hypothetical protein
MVANSNGPDPEIDKKAIFVAQLSRIHKQNKT